MTAFPASGVPGIIAAPTVQPLTIYGSNFVSGSVVTVNNGTTSYPVSSIAVLSANQITANVTIASVPPDSYVSVTVYSPTGNSVRSILGVAHAYKSLASDIQTILTSNCAPCHGTSGNLDMSTVQLSATNLINASSTGCPQKFRVTYGDPRRANNVLVDLIKANTTPALLSCNANRTISYRQMPPVGSPVLSNADIVAIVDWIALGAN
jgi:hypothetical protein